MLRKTPPYTSNAEAELEALDRSQAVIRFDLDGTILYANENFLDAMGYELEEVKGKHHRIFMPDGEENTPEYEQFWERLNHGEYFRGEFKRVGKGGKEIWIQACYNPVFDKRGKPVNVVKYAADITEQKLRSMDTNGQIEAIHRSQAVIEFKPDGTIITANPNFLGAVGYDLSEVQGNHHRIFMPEGEASTPEYKAFWEKLAAGEFAAGEFKRIGKGGKEIWIQASYNPILDDEGRTLKVVKFASDITEEKLRSSDAKGQIEAINRAQAVIHFELDGTIIEANENFLAGLGYAPSEVVGQHHRMFVEPAEANSQEYKEFWNRLAKGIYDTRVYKRIKKNGEPIWIQASYNPIFNADGKPYKVVKFATDVTDVVETQDIAENALGSVQGVAAAIEEMTASISEISENMSHSRSAAGGIMKEAQESSVAATQLTQSMKVMEGIIDLINDIAGQVNLLALNATIEAARAGEAGKGFAVVASEVKSLATQTTKATEDIASQISEVQGVAGAVASTVENISDSATNVNDYITGVASAVEEQSSVIKEISANTQRMTHSIEDIASRIRALSEVGN